MRLPMALCAMALIVGGLALGGVGAWNLYDEHTRYQVAFTHSGADCGAEAVAIDVQTGKALNCTRTAPFSPNDQTPTFPGFTAEQNANVLALAEQLAGDDGLSKAEQKKVQASVRSYASTAQHHGFWWGANNLVAGLGAVGLGALLYAGLLKQVRSRAS